MTCSDECAVEKAEGQEFAYFSGYVAARKNERKRIIEIIERCPRIDNDYMIQCDARHLIALIEGENK